MNNIVQRIALSLGDPNGIGPEIALKATADLTPSKRDALTVFGSRHVWLQTASSLGLSDLANSIRFVDTGEFSDSQFRPGEISAAAGACAVASAKSAIEYCQKGLVDAVIACPHHETAIHQANIEFTGYPSLVAKVCNLKDDEVFLMLVGAGLRIVHVTLHESVQSALNRLTPELIERAALAGIEACIRLGVSKPNVAVFGINPHASEGQLFGLEDKKNTVPAVASLISQGHSVDGPQGGDVYLAKRSHDLYVAIFHDQGHIPIKMLAPNAASALSIGAQVILSSVGHGSAMDIAGKGLADPEALLRTISLIAPQI